MDGWWVGPGVCVWFGLVGDWLGWVCGFLVGVWVDLDGFVEERMKDG